MKLTTRIKLDEVNEDYLRRAHAICLVIVIENRHSMKVRWHEKSIDVCKELQIAYKAFSPMANRTLTGVYQSKADFGAGEQDFRVNIPQYSDEGIAKKNELLNVVIEIGEKHQATSA